MPKKETIALKEAKVLETKELMEKAAGVIILDYKTLSVKEGSALRIQLEESASTFKVIKNNFVKRAAESLGYNELTQFCVGQNAVLLIEEDFVSSLKTITNFIKANEKLEIKAGYINGEYNDAAQLNVLATLRSKPELIATFAAMLNSPLVKFGIAMKEIAKQKES